MTTVLNRTAFATSRMMEFFTEKELQMQIGHDKWSWPIALAKELIDNALDACETAGHAPKIVVSADGDAVSVEDNGPGLPVEVLDRSLDYLVRVSDKNHYISPTRGQLGNALKCVWAAPFVATGQRGRVDVITGGDVHQIDVALDRIAQQPALQRTVYPDGIVKTGTLVRMNWPNVASLLEHQHTTGFYNAPAAYDIRLSALCAYYSAFNPHAEFTYTAEIPGTTDRISLYMPAMAPNWQKWRTDSPTSPHWYTVEQLCSLIAAYVNTERDGGKVRTVREFVSEFRGLSGTAKQREIVAVAGLGGAYLHDLVSAGDVDRQKVKLLLVSMRQASRDVRPTALGVIGEEHLAGWMQRRGISADSIGYKKIAGTASGRPFVVEVAFGVHGKSVSDREIVVGLNWSPALRNPLAELASLLGENRVDSWDPVCLVVHLASPHFHFTDRGKSRLALDDEIRQSLASAVETVTKHWKQAKRAADRQDRVSERELEELRKSRRRVELSIKDATYQVMQRAYLYASGTTGMANARQIMYAARPLVQELTRGKCWRESSYFTQRLLPQFVEDNPSLTANWDVIYDARGKLIEPHTDTRVDLGTLEVRRYIDGWTTSVKSPSDISLDHRVETSGPANRYSYALFIEKEGFNELLQHGQIAERNDLAIMSTKGMSVTAARQLVASLSDQGVTILVAHDFDKAGFSILHTLRSDTRRWQYRKAPNVIDLGLRLTDVDEMDLQSESVEYDGQTDPKINLRQSGATKDECSFLVHPNASGRGWSGKRVELNAMTSDQFLAWLHRKLNGIGVTKQVPAPEALEAAYRLALHRAYIQKAIDEANANYDRSDVSVPDALADEVKRRIAGTSSAWDDAIFEIAKENLAYDE